jgi:hypothetical protein
VLISLLRSPRRKLTRLVPSLAVPSVVLLMLAHWLGTGLLLQKFVNRLPRPLALRLA